jgi:hypothetical protein
MHSFMSNRYEIMRKLIILFVLILLCGCSSDKESKLETINPGLYELKFTLNYEGQSYIVLQKTRYNSDGSYTAITYNNDIAVEELEGKYKVENDRLVYFDKRRRAIRKDGTWAQWEEIKSSSVLIRNIDEGSYQYYLDAPDERAKAQYEALGISVGWKTLLRISG